MPAETAFHSLQIADPFALIAGNRHIIRNCFDGIIVFVIDMVVAVIPEFLHLAAEMDVNRLIRIRRQPDFAAGQPIIRQLGLPAVDDLLFENAILI